MFPLKMFQNVGGLYILYIKHILVIVFKSFKYGNNKTKTQDMSKKLKSRHQCKNKHAHTLLNILLM